MTAGLTLMKSVLIALAKPVLLPFGLSAAMSDAVAAIQKNLHGLGMTALIISDEEIKDIMKMFKSLEESELLIKGISETIKNEAKEQKGGILPVILVTLAASILRNALTRKGIIRAGEGTIRAGQDF